MGEHAARGGGRGNAARGGGRANPARVRGGEQVEELLVLVRGEAEVGRRVQAGDGRVEGGHGGRGGCNR